MNKLVKPFLLTFALLFSTPAQASDYIKLNCVDSEETQYAFEVSFSPTEKKVLDEEFFQVLDDYIFFRDDEYATNISRASGGFSVLHLKSKKLVSRGICEKITSNKF